MVAGIGWNRLSEFWLTSSHTLNTLRGATFSSAELTSQSEKVSGGAVQIGNAITEKMVMDVLLTARDRGPTTETGGRRCGRSALIP